MCLEIVDALAHTRCSVHIRPLGINATLLFLQVILDPMDWQAHATLQGVFDDLTADELAIATASASDAALTDARMHATERLIDGPGAGLGHPSAVMPVLVDRDETHASWERLVPYEQRWALLVLKIVAPVMDPLDAVSDARRRGSTWSAIADVLGVTAQAAQQRFTPRLSLQ